MLASVILAPNSALTVKILTHATVVLQDRIYRKELVLSVLLPIALTAIL